MIFSNFYPVPEFPFNILPFIYGALLLAGLLWYAYLRWTKPEVAERIGTIQTLSEAEQRGSPTPESSRCSVTKAPRGTTIPI